MTTSTIPTEAVIAGRETGPVGLVPSPLLSLGAAVLRLLQLPLTRRLLLAGAIGGGAMLAGAAWQADRLGVGGDPGVGGLQLFGIVTGLSLAVSVAASTLSLEHRRWHRPAVALGLAAVALGVAVLYLALFTTFQDRVRARVLQFAYVEGVALVVIGGRAAWVSGLRRWGPVGWLLPKLHAAWLAFDEAIGDLGPPLRRFGAFMREDSAVYMPLLRQLVRLPALDLAVAGLLVTWVVMRTASPAESARAVFVPAAYLLLPFLIGYLALRVVERARGNLREWTPASRYVAGWFLGAGLLTAVAMAFQQAGFRAGLKHLDVTGIGLTILGWLAVNFPHHRESLRIRVGDLTSPLRHHWPLLVVIAFSLAPRLITGYYSPFPLIERNFSDPRITSQDTLRMIQDGYLTLTNVSHPPGVVSVTGAIAAVLRIEPLSIMWAASVAQFAIFAAGLYALTWRLTGSRLTGVVAGLFGIFIFSGSVGFEGTPLRLRSNTLIYSFFPLVLAMVCEVVGEERARPGRSLTAIARPLVFLGVAQLAFFLVMNLQVFTGFDIRWRGLVLAAALGAVLVGYPLWRGAARASPGIALLLLLIGVWQLFHVYESPLFVASMLLLALVLALARDGRDRWVAVCLVVAVAAVAGGIVFAQLLPSTTASRLIFGSTYVNKTGGVGLKLNLMEQATAAVAFGFFLLGTLVALRQRSRYLLTAVTMAAAGYALYFFPDAHTIRAYKVITPFAALLCAVGAVWLYGGLRRRTRSPWLAPALGVAGLVAIAFFISRPLQNHFAGIPSGQSYFSSLSDAEYAAIDWLKTNAGAEVRIVSDYQTMQLFNTVGNFPSLVERKYWPAEMSVAGRAQIRFIKEGVFGARRVDLTEFGETSKWGLELGASDRRAAYYRLNLLRRTEPAEEKQYLAVAGKDSGNERLFVVVSGRTSAWLDRESHDPIFTPQNLSPQSSEMDLFNDQRYFTPVFNFGDYLYLWEVKPPEGD